MKLYNSCVPSVMSYGAECWRMSERDTNKLSSFHNDCLRKIFKIFWPTKNLQQRTTWENIHLRPTCFSKKKNKTPLAMIKYVLRKPTDLNRISLRWTPEDKRQTIGSRPSKDHLETDCRDRDERNGPNMPGNGDEGKSQRRVVEETSPYHMCLRVQQGLSR